MCERPSALHPRFRPQRPCGLLPIYCRPLCGWLTVIIKCNGPQGSRRHQDHGGGETIKIANTKIRKGRAGRKQRCTLS
jgi:hypothetical protein